MKKRRSSERTELNEIQVGHRTLAKRANACHHVDWKVTDLGHQERTERRYRTLNCLTLLQVIHRAFPRPIEVFVCLLGIEESISRFEIQAVFTVSVRLPKKAHDKGNSIIQSLF